MKFPLFVTLCISIFYSTSTYASDELCGDFTPEIDYIKKEINIPSECKHGDYIGVLLSSTILVEYKASLCIPNSVVLESADSFVCKYAGKYEANINVAKSGQWITVKDSVNAFRFCNLTKGYSLVKEKQYYCYKK